MANTLQTDYDVTETECDECEDGILWVNSFELICGNCGVVTRKEELGWKHMDPVEEYQAERDDHRYEHSERVIMPGGFEEAYQGSGIYGDPDG